MYQDWQSYTKNSKQWTVDQRYENTDNMKDFASLHTEHSYC